MNMPLKQAALAAAWGLSAALMAGGAAAADPYVGASASGDAAYYSLQCGTCPIDSGPVAHVVDGGLTVFGAGYQPGQEVQSVLDFDYAGANASVAGVEHFTLGGSVSFTVDPGDSFYVWGNLDAYANSSHQVVGTVDALHTLAMAFSGGDTSLLTAEVGAVSEPSPAALVLAGLATLAALVRRCHAASSTRRISRP